MAKKVDRTKVGAEYKVSGTTYFTHSIANHIMTARNRVSMLRERGIEAISSEEMIGRDKWAYIIMIPSSQKQKSVEYDRWAKRESARLRKRDAPPAKKPKSKPKPKPKSKPKPKKAKKPKKTGRIKVEAHPRKGYTVKATTVKAHTRKRR